MNTYTVRQFRDMVGIPYSSLRYYERIGLIKPLRNPDNNYRAYTAIDAFLLNRFKFYRSIGLDVKKSIELIYNQDKEILSQYIGEQEMKLKNEIFLCAQQLKSIRKLKKDIISTEKEANYSIDYMCDKYFLPASKGSDFSASTFDDFSKWADLLPVTSYCKRLKVEDFHVASNRELDYGISIDASNIHLLDKKFTTKAEFIKGGKCIKFYSTKFNFPKISVSIIENTLEYIRENGYIMTGYIYIEGVKFVTKNTYTGQIISIPVK